MITIFKELLGFIGVFVLLCVMTMALLIILPFVILHYVSELMYKTFRKPIGH